MKTYNGFTHAERVRGWQAEKVAITMGLMPNPMTLACDVCGTVAPQQIGYHAEDYTKLILHPLCRSCHTSLHRRFTSPHAWLQRIAPYRTGHAWFEQLPLSDISMVPVGENVRHP